jgi:exodeoxyribonuclease-3
MKLGLLTLNVANPSAARAERQLEWLSARPEQVFVLTETGASGGSRLLLERLASAGWEVRAGAEHDRERGVAIAARLRVAAREGNVLDVLPSRAERVRLAGLEVVGLYVPSRDDSLEKVERKRCFCQALSRFLAQRPPGEAVVIGDLNVLEPVHRPHHGIFRDWEYRLYDEFVVRGFVDAFRLLHPDEIAHSWIDYENRGYRFDHVFVSESLAEGVLRCDYLHETREMDLSDHSALVIELDWHDGVEELDVHDSLTGQAPSLF